jgi:multidrug resistance efflux pump
MEKIIFFGLVIPIFIFVLYLGSRAIMTGFSAKNTNKSNLEIDSDEESENSLNDTKNLTSELNKLNELFESGALTQEEFEKAKKKILDN